MTLRQLTAICAILVMILVVMLNACSTAGAGGTRTSESSEAPPDSSESLGTPAPDPDLPVQICGVAGTIDIAFVIPPAVRYDDAVPGFYGAPELAGQHGSLVLFYEGFATIKYLTGIPSASREPTQRDIVCVVTPDGQPTIYEDVSREGIAIPPGASIPIPVTDASICQQFPDAPICKPPDSPTVEATPSREAIGSPSSEVSITEAPTEPSDIPAVP